MIGILERYIIKQLIRASALVTLIMGSILFLIAMLAELKNIGEGDYGLLQALAYVAMRLPNELYQFSPLLLLLGSIIGLSILSSHQELSVMRSSGFSIRRVLYSVFLAAFLLSLLISGIGEGLTPQLNYKAAINKDNEQNAGQVVVTRAGVWLHIDNNFIHIKNVLGRHLLEGVTKYQFDQAHRLVRASHAKRLRYQNNEWRMYDVVSTLFINKKNKMETIREVVAEVPLKLKINTNIFGLGVVDPSEMSLLKLADFARYLHKNGLQASDYQYEFWRRIFLPLASLIMIFLAVPFVLGSLRATSIGLRIVLGLVVGFAFFIFNAFLGQLCIVFQVPAALAAFLPLLLFAIFGLVLFRRMVKY